MQYLKEKTNTQKPYVSANLKNWPRWEFYHWKKKKQILWGGKRMYSSYCTHIYIPSCRHQFLPHSGFAVNGTLLVPVKHRWWHCIFPYHTLTAVCMCSILWLHVILKDVIYAYTDSQCNETCMHVSMIGTSKILTVLFCKVRMIAPYVQRGSIQSFLNISLTHTHIHTLDH